MSADERIAVLDFGSQLTQLVARRIRDLGVYSEVFCYTTDESEVRDFKPCGIILSGSDQSTLQDDAPEAPGWVWKFGVPVLGICYGMQLMATQLGGKTTRCARQEFGKVRVTVPDTDGLFTAIAHETTVWMSHGDQVSHVPPGFRGLASSDACPFAAMGDDGRHFYGVQYHPESSQTEEGQQLFMNFLREICGCRRFLWGVQRIVETLVADTKTAVENQAGEGDVLLGLSGGVDSSVVAAILHRAIGPRLKCVMIDTGLMRLNEVASVIAAFDRMAASDAGSKPMNIQVVDASDTFFTSLEGVADPEEKRHIIGREFIRAFERVAETYENVKVLAQGTIYPDVIESAKVGNASLIKTHHNVGGIPKDSKFKLIEPLRRLFKDEVRNVGEALGLPHEFVWRHPFPGPGLGVRILGQVTREAADKLRAADAIFMEEIQTHGWYSEISQALTALIPAKAVAVKGDKREYAEMIVLRAIKTKDFMTAQVVDIPSDLLKLISRRICNEVRGVSRVLYDYTDKPPATIEYE